MGVMSEITRGEVAHLAKLARLALDDEELDHYADQLDAILDAVTSISAVAADDVPATSHPVPMTNKFRPDEVVPCLSREAALSGAPDAEDDRFRVPRILGEES
jgi:aspartyl-tRNA(Asn)/glutamyl-tRNA(Gln) amidotransferase subunit C